MDKIAAKNDPIRLLEKSKSLNTKIAIVDKFK
jgi:hypothetical protein